MTQAIDFQNLYESGYIDQAFKLANNMSISLLQDWLNGSTVFFFDDDSAIFMNDTDFRVATTDERV